MAAPSTDHYQTLGVDPAATAREIKKAYFALVRQFPPETHPEEFQRLREAYEVLSDPEGRRQYDSARAHGGTEYLPFDELGPELAPRLRAAVVALNGERGPEAVAILDPIVGQHPGLAPARDLLGLAYMATGQFAEAAQQFQELIGRDPRNPLYHVRLGHALRDLGKEKEAFRAYSAAKEVAPQEPGVRFALSDFYAHKKKWKDALAELDAAQEALRGHDGDWEPKLRRIMVQVQRKSSRRVKQEVEALLGALPKEEELRQFIAERLSSMAARSFALQRTSDANLLLRTAQSLRPHRQLGEFPQRVKVELDRLPEAAREWLKEERASELVKPFASRGLLGPWLVLLLGLGVMWLDAMLLLSAAAARHRWGPGDWSWLSLLLAAGPGLAASGIRGIVRASRSPYGAFTTLHPHYLVQVKVDRLVAWPLINLVHVQVTHNHQYAIYVGSTIRLKFGGKSAAINIRGKQAAEDFSNAAAGCRGRLLDLLNSGLLEADPGFDFLPQELLVQGQPDPERWRRRARRARWPALAAAAGLATLAAALPLNLRSAGEAEWEVARTGGMQSLVEYVKRGGRHREEARRMLAAAFDQALARVASSGAGPEEQARLRQIVEALRDAGTNRVRVEYSPAVELGGYRVPSQLAARMVAVSGITVPTQRARHYRVSAVLQQRLDQLLGPGVAVIDPTSASSGAPVTLRVASVLELSGGAYALSGDPGHRYFGLQLAADLEVLLGGEAAPRFRVQVTAGPDREVRWSEGPAPTPEVVYGAMADAAADALGGKLADALAAVER